MIKIKIKNKEDWKELKENIYFCKKCGEALDLRKARKMPYKYDELDCKCGEIIYT